MIWHRLKLIVVAGTALILAVITTGMLIFVYRSEQAAEMAARAALERSALAVENALNRQLLQVHGALASLPTLFAAAKISPRDPLASDLLRGLNFQTLAFRDLLLVAPDNTILAAGRPRGARRILPVEPGSLGRGHTVLLGPVRNIITGDWSIYIARSVPSWDGITPVAEVPIPTLMNLLAETGLDPQMQIRIERPNGQLVAALPHDEVRTGQVADAALGRHDPDGRAFDVTDGGEQRLAVVRGSIYGDIRVVLTAGRGAMLAEWKSGRVRTVAVAAAGGVLITAFAAALLFGIRQREQAEADRTRSATVLANAIEAMSDGFVMWDENDRLVTCNQRYRDLYALTAPFLIPGARFEDVLREGAKNGQYPGEWDDLDAFVAERLAWHRDGSGATERQLPDGRWLLVKQSRTADGGIVGIRTDITALKTTLAELAEANIRANAAAAEARRQNAALVQRESHIRYLAHHDDLTGLPNRVLFRGRIQAALRATERNAQTMALLYLDLDRFKDVNDTLGHPAGDALLRVVANRLRACVDEPDNIARLSGDEFAIITIGLSQPQMAVALSARIVEELSRPYSILGHTIAISASVGIAIAGDTGADADSLLKQSDLALYQAKANGRGTVCVFAPDMDERLHARLEMEADLRVALRHSEFELLYQPIYALDSMQLNGFEALLRWHHPRHGLIEPTAFIPLAEETRLIADIGRWVLERACSDAAGFPPHLRVSVNLSPVQLAGTDIVETVRDALGRHGVDAHRLELEITETALFTDDQRNMETLQRLRALGVRIVLDDFGTGYSSLSHLRAFPLDKIKIDRSFVRDMTFHPDSAAIVESIASLAQRLGMATTAEGIETGEQLDAARRAGCTEGQGYFLGEPLPASRATDGAGASPDASAGMPLPPPPSWLPPPSEAAP